jgi:hypothetical protein
VPILVIPAVIFFCCGFTQFWFYRRMRRALIERHPDLYLAISHKAFFPDSALMRFAFSRRARDLNDPVLSSAVRQVRLLLCVGFAAWIAVAGLLVTGLGGWPVVR